MWRAITYLVVSMLFWLTLLNSTSDAEENLKDLAKSIQPAVVTVFCYDLAGKPVRQGSGFLFGVEAHLITNYHVLGDVAMGKIKMIDGKEYNIKTIVGEDKANDLIRAIVDLPRGSARFLSPAKTPPKAGDRIAVLGSPLGAEYIATGGSIADIRGTGDGQTIVYNAHSFPGSSGSPVVNHQGHVVGIVSAGIRGLPNVNYAIPVQRIDKLNQVWRHLATSPETASSDRNVDDRATIQTYDQNENPDDPEAQVKLAMMYEEGREVRKNCLKAFDLYRKAALRGAIQAEYHLGRMYYESECISHNSSEAERWFRKAADRGHANAQYSLGLLYMNGEGVPRDSNLACMWLILAASRGNEPAKKTLRFLSTQMTREQVEQAKQMAQNWKPR